MESLRDRKAGRSFARIERDGEEEVKGFTRSGYGSLRLIPSKWASSSGDVTLDRMIAGTSGGADPATFAHEIAPQLANVTLTEMMEATGLSRPYCAMIRRGVRVPHARHWSALRMLVS